MSDWIASHDGPGKVRSTHTTSVWVDAANWLRAMIEVWSPPQRRTLAYNLSVAEPGEAYVAHSDGHTFEIVRAGTPQAQPDLFQ